MFNKKNENLINVKASNKGVTLVISFVAVLELALWIFLILHIISNK